MNPDDRGCWFPDGFFPHAVNGISLVTKVAFKNDEGITYGHANIADKYGLLDTNMIKNILYITTGEWSRGHQNYGIYVPFIAINGFEISCNEAPWSYDETARLQARLVVNNFSEAMLSHELNISNYVSCKEWNTTIDKLTEEVSGLVAIYGSVIVAAYVTGGVRSIDAISHCLKSGIDLEIAVALQ